MKVQVTDRENRFPREGEWGWVKSGNRWYKGMIGIVATGRGKVERDFSGRGVAGCGSCVCVYECV